MNKRNRLQICAGVVGVLVLVSGCTRNKKGADAFEHYFRTSPPAGVKLIQSRWTEYYNATGLDAEQTLLEFTAPAEVLKELFPFEVSQEKASVDANVKEEVLGASFDSAETDAVREGLAAAPSWFRPGSTARYQVSFDAGRLAIVRFDTPAKRYLMMIYDRGNGHIFIDATAGRVYVAQGEGGKLF